MVRDEHVCGMYTDKLIEIEKIKQLFSQMNYPHEEFVKKLPHFDHAEAQLKLLEEKIESNQDLMWEICDRVNEGDIKTSGK